MPTAEEISAYVESQWPKLLKKDFYSDVENAGRTAVLFGVVLRVAYDLFASSMNDCERVVNDAKEKLEVAEKRAKDAVQQRDVFQKRVQEALQQRDSNLKQAQEACQQRDNFQKQAQEACQHRDDLQKQLQEAVKQCEVAEKGSKEALRQREADRQKVASLEKRIKELEESRKPNYPTVSAKLEKQERQAAPPEPNFQASVIPETMERSPPAVAFKESLASSEEVIGSPNVPLKKKSRSKLARKPRRKVDNILAAFARPSVPGAVKISTPVEKSKAVLKQKPEEPKQELKDQRILPRTSPRLPRRPLHPPASTNVTQSGSPIVSSKVASSKKLTEDRKSAQKKLEVKETPTNSPRRTSMRRQEAEKKKEKAALEKAEQKKPDLALKGKAVKPISSKAKKGIVPVGSTPQSCPSKESQVASSSAQSTASVPSSLATPQGAGGKSKKEVPNVKRNIFAETQNSPKGTKRKSDESPEEEKKRQKLEEEETRKKIRAMQKEKSSKAKKEEPLRGYVFQRDPVRNKEDRDKLPAYACRECIEYVQQEELTPDSFAKRLKQLCKHRGDAPAKTPPEFYDMSF